MRQYFIGSLFQLASFGFIFALIYRYFAHALPLFVPIAYFLNSLLGLRAIGFKSEKGILVYVFTSSFLFALPFSFVAKALVENFLDFPTAKEGLAHLISVILDVFGNTSFTCKYLLISFTAFIFTLCFTLQIFLLVLAKRVRTQILTEAQTAESSNDAEVELQDYKSPQSAFYNNGYMPVSSRDIPIYVDAQGNVVQ